MSAWRDVSVPPGISLGDTSPSSVANISGTVPVPDGCVSSQAFPVSPWDSQNSSVSKQTDDTLKVVITGTCLPVLFLVSFCTNLLNMAVFYRHGLRETINACLFTLSLLDLLSVTVLFAYSSDALYTFVMGQVGIGPSAQFFIRNHVLGVSGLVTSSQLVYSVIAVERCLCVTRPLLVKHCMSARTTMTVLWALTFILTGCFMVIAAVRYTVLCVVHQADGRRAYLTYPTSFYFRHRLVLDVLFSYIYGVLLPSLSALCVAVCTIVTAVTLKRLSQWRETASSASGSLASRDLAVTRTIVVTSVLFIACIVPGVALRASVLLVPVVATGRHFRMTLISIRLYILASAVNSTFNFFIYYACGTRFRDTTRRLLPFVYGRAAPPQHHTPVAKTKGRQMSKY